MKVTQMPPAHAANLVANSGNTVYGVDLIGKGSRDDPRARTSWNVSFTDCLLLSNVPEPTEWNENNVKDPDL